MQRMLFFWQFLVRLLGTLLSLVRAGPETKALVCPARRKRRVPKRTPIRIFPQDYEYSCAASVLQTALHSMTGEVIEHDRAVRLTRCRPHGAQLQRIASALARHCAAKPKRLKRLATVRSALCRGDLVISSDCISWGGRRAVLLVGATRKAFI